MNRRKCQKFLMDDATSLVHHISEMFAENITRKMRTRMLATADDEVRDMMSISSEMKEGQVDPLQNPWLVSTCVVCERLSVMHQPARLPENFDHILQNTPTPFWNLVPEHPPLIIKRVQVQPYPEHPPPKC